jgi:murein DD-endopeptidase MepM/ murein hydrolase activator NlpD
MATFSLSLRRAITALFVAALLTFSAADPASADGGGSAPLDGPSKPPVKPGTGTGGGGVPEQPKPKPKVKPKKKATKKPAKKPAKKKPAKKKPTKKKPVAPPVAQSAWFPVVGSGWTFGDAGMRFGAPRTGHTHQGQDVAGPEGLQIVAPVAGTISWVSYQAAGAGYYVVERGTDGRDYVFMHLMKGSTRVQIGQVVAAGKWLGNLGNTGDSSGPHLHFEIWVGGWYETGGHPIDPLPQLQAWARLSRRH